MTEAEVRALAARMATGATINPSLTSEALKLLFGASLEAHGVRAGSLARTLRLAGAVSPGTATVLGDARAYAPATADPFHEILVMERNGQVFALSVQWSGKPNPKTEAMLARLVGDRAVPRRENGPVTDRASRMKAFALDGHHDVARLVADVTADAWRGDCLFSTTPAFEVSGEGWFPGTSAVYSVDHWPEFFDALRRTLADRVAPDAKIADRRWIGNAAGMAEYDAARELGTRLAEADGFLPGPACLAGLATLHGVQAEMNVAKFARDGWFDRIHAACIDRGHVDAESSFDFNDCDDHVFAGTRDGLRVLWFRDDHYRTVVDIEGDAERGAVTVSAAPADGDDDPKPIGRFEIAGGEVRTLAGPSAVGDDIRAWNCFVSILESADCVLEEEYGRRPSP